MTHTTRVKICGLTSVADAQAAAEQGADAIGLMFYSKSPRYIELELAAQIAQRVGPFVTLVGLFVNAEAETVKQVLRAVPLHVLQFHGDETREYCEQFQRPYVKALRVESPSDTSDASLQAIRHALAAVCDNYASASGILLDAYSKQAYGGTGEQFNWQCIPDCFATMPLILAGGLHADNVAAAIAQTKPYAVDVSSGVETSPGVKDHLKIKQFIENARRAGR